MNRQEAIEALKEGKYLTHKTFGDWEYIHTKNGIIETEDGYDFSYQFHKATIFNDGWQIKKLTNEK